MKKVSLLAFSSLAVIGSMLVVNPAAAQETDTAEDANANVITVTARKRTETDLEVPVAIKAIGAAQLERQGIRSLQDVAAITPSLTVSASTGASGGTIVLRGIGTPPAGAGTDSAISINIDGVTIAEGAVLRMGQFDLAQIEVLQGPQSLYFGKNSSGGIISLTTADPTDSPYAMLRAGYTFQSRNLLTEGVVSTPLADGLGVRLAVQRSDQKGYFINPLATDYALGVPTAAQIATYGPLPQASSRRLPEETNTMMRGTLKYESDLLTVRLKGTYMQRDGSDSFATGQLYYCPYGAPDSALGGNVAGIGDCELNKYGQPIGRNATQAEGGDPDYRDGTPYSDMKQYLFTGSVDYELSDGISLSSVTGYYKLDLITGDIVTSSPYPAVGSVVRTKRNDFTQELRLTTDLDSPLNGMFGLYYQNGDNFADVEAYIPAFGGALDPPSYYVDTRTYGIFGQLTYALADDTVFLSAGGRYTDEKKDLRVVNGGVNIEDVFSRKSIRSKKFSPEVSASWRPSRDTNVFLTYKKGTKSGGFNLSALLPPNFVGNDIGFDDENAEGFEGGVKSLVMDGQLRLDLTAYRYTYKDLQVSIFDPTLGSTATQNAATARIYGVQFNTSYTPRSIPNLNIGASVNYGHSRYLDYMAGCYVGQTAATGCVNQRQDLAGRPLTAAPDWTGAINASYDFAINQSDTRIGISAGANYSDRFEAVYNQPPNSAQRSSVNIDAQLRLFNEESGWELALIGKNLTNKMRVRWGIEAPFTPSIPGNLADLYGVPNEPRMIMLRATVKLGDK